MERSRYELLNIKPKLGGALRDDLRTLAMSQVVANIPQFDYGIQI